MGSSISQYLSVFWVTVLRDLFCILFVCVFLFLHHFCAFSKFGFSQLPHCLQVRHAYEDDVILVLVALGLCFFIEIFTSHLLFTTVVVEGNSSMKIAEGDGGVCYSGLCTLGFRNITEEAVVSKKRGTGGNPVQSTYFSFSIWVITPKIGWAKNTSSHTVSNFSAGPSGGGALYPRAHTDMHCD